MRAGAGKYKLGTGAGKYKLRAGTCKYKLRAGVRSFKRMCSWIWEKLKIVDKEFLLCIIKKQDSSTYVNVFVSLLLFHRLDFALTYNAVFLWRSEKSNFTNKVSTRVN